MNTNHAEDGKTPLSPAGKHSTGKVLFFLSVLLPLLVLGLSLMQPAPVAASCGGAATSAATEAELNAAISAFNGCAAGTFTITFTADITLTADTTKINNTNNTDGLFIEGGGFTLSGDFLGKTLATEFGHTSPLSISDLTVVRSSDNGVESYGPLTITGSSLLLNQGNGIFIPSTGQAATISRSTIASNGRAGIYSFHALTIEDSTITENSDYGIYAEEATALTNSTVSYNRIDGLTSYGPVTVLNSTFKGNSNSLAAYGSTTTVHNSIFADSTFSDCTTFSATVDIQNSLFSDDGSAACGAANGTDGNLTNADPVLGPLADNGGPTRTYALLDISGDITAVSPAVDAGSNALAGGLTYDQRGPFFSRILNGTVDMGAYEGLQAITCSFPIIVASEAALNQAITCFNALTAGGFYTIELSADIPLTASTETVNNVGSGARLTISGNGRTVDGQNGPGVRPFTIATGTTVSIQNTIITGGDAFDGGGIRNQGKLQVSGSTVSGNAGRGELGGGIYSDYSLNIGSSTISDNSAYKGGGIYATGGLAVSGSTISGNTARFDGSGIFTGFSSEPSLIANTTVSGNTSANGRGGGIAMVLAELLINNSTIANNHAGDKGGGIAILPFGCFTAGVEVLLADGARRPIADLQTGDEVLSYDFARGRQVTAAVRSTLTRRVDEFLRINGLEVTAEHPFAVGANQWREAGELRTGDRVLSENGWMTIETIEHVREEVEVHNIDVDGPQNYYVVDGAGSYLVHNKDVAAPSLVTINNGILTNNSATNGDDDCLGEPIAGSNNLIDDFAVGACSAISSAAVTYIDLTLANNGGPTLTHALLPGSSAVDFGSNALATGEGGNPSAPLISDQRGFGFPRIVAGVVDAGAYEAGTTGFTIIKDAVPPDGTDFPFTAIGQIVINPPTSVITAVPSTNSPALISGTSYADGPDTNAVTEPTCFINQVDGTAATASGGTINVECNFVLDDAVPDDLDAVTDTFVFSAVGSTPGGIVDRAASADSGFSDIESFEFTITESVVPGWRLEDITCTTPGSSAFTPDLAQGKVDIQVEPGRHMTCTFSNEAEGITIIKDAAPPAGTDFTFFMDSAGCSQPITAPESGSPLDTTCQARDAAQDYQSYFYLDDAVPDDNDGISDREFFGPLAPGEYTFTEFQYPGWRLADITCEGATQVSLTAGNPVGSTYSVDLQNGILRINYSAGDQVACTFKNEATTAVTIIKDAAPPDGTNFPFEALIGPQLLPQPAAAVAVESAAGLMELNTPAPLPFPFILDDAVPDDGDAYGDSQTFYFFLETPATAGSAGISDEGIDSVSALVATIQVDEKEVAGWKLADIACSGQTESSVTPDKDGRTVTVDLVRGEHVTCTFTNEQDSYIKLIESYAVSRVVEGQLSGEGSKACWWVTSTVELDGEVVIDIAPQNGEVTVDKTQVTLDSTNWDNLGPANRSNFVCLRAVDDQIDDGGMVTCKEGADDLYGSNPATSADEECGDHKDYVKHTIAGSTDSTVTTSTPFMSNNTVTDLDSDPSTVDALVVDDDEAGVILTESYAVSDLDEDGSPVGKACYWITLASEPVGDVTVDITADNTEVQVNKTQVTLTPANWNLLDTADSAAFNKVCITPINDDSVDAPNPTCHTGSAALLGQSGTGATVCGTHLGVVDHAINTSADPNYDNSTPFSNNDGPLPGSDLEVIIRDDDVPAVTFNPATVNLLEGSSASYEVTLTSRPKSAVTVTSSGRTVTFQPDTWNVPQTITVDAPQDNTAEKTQTILFKHTVRSADKDYDKLAAGAVEVTVVDDDSAGVFLSTTLVEVSEDGATAAYEIVLTSQPAAGVSVTLTADSQLKVSPAVVRFSAANWNVPQRVTVSGVDDAVAEDALHGASIKHSVASADSFYNVVAVAKIKAAVADNDVAGVLLNKESVAASEDGTVTARYSAVLSSQPRSAVTVTLDGGGQVAPVPAQLTFTAANWNRPQSVKVTAVDDLVDEGYVYNTVLAHKVGSKDSFYEGLQLEDLPAAITDNDEAGIALSQTAVKGLSGSYTVVLTSQPQGPVVVDLAANGGILLEGTGCESGEDGAACLLFTPDSWDSPQTVRFTSYAPGSVSHQVASGDRRYEALQVKPVGVNAIYSIFMPVARGG